MLSSAGQMPLRAQGQVEVGLAGLGGVGAGGHGCPCPAVVTVPSLLARPAPGGFPARVAGDPAPSWVPSGGCEPPEIKSIHFCLHQPGLVSVACNGEQD